MINFNSKKVQYIIFAIAGGCVLLFVILHLLVLPSIRSWKEDSAKTMEIQEKLAEMRALVQTRPAVQSQIESARAKAKSMAAHIPLPVLGNYLLGMETYLRACGAKTGIGMPAIADNDVLEIMPGDSLFKIYRVRVQVRADFHDYIQLAENIYRGNPLISISGLNIVAGADNPLAHETSFIVSWLVWSDPAKRPAFLFEKP